jgi:DNA (cytosine-5)-methyltransferase 1
MHTFIDLFCGIGGFRLALEERGLRCVFSSDIDLHVQEAYRENFRERPQGDIRDISVHTIPPHDILCAGFPCQPFSVAGKREGLNSKEGQLFYEIVRIARFHLPPLLLLENVSNIVSLDDGKVIGQLEHELHTIGYKIYRHVLNASSYGIPQSRIRVYFVAVRKDLPLISLFPIPTEEKIYLEDILEQEVDERLFIQRDDMVFDCRERGYEKALHPLRIGYFNKKGQGERIYSPSGHAVTLLTFPTKTGLYEINGRVRRLSVGECKSVMGFPGDHYVSEGTKGLKQLGNAVIPKMVGHIYDSIIFT